MPRPGQAMPSREEIIAYIRQVAAVKGIDPDTFLTVVNGESGFDPGARGDYDKQGVPQSVGLAQLFSGGEAPEFTRRTGLDPADPSNWKAQIDFMAERVLQGGWKPWHAAKNNNVDPWEGVPGGPKGQAPGRRGRTGELAQLNTPVPGVSAADPETGNRFGGPDMEEWRRMWTDMQKPQKTLGQAAVLGLDKLLGGNSTKTQTLGAAVLKPLLGKSQEEEEVADAALKGKGGVPYNPMMAMSREAQVDALKPKTVGSSIMGMFTPPGVSAPGIPKPPKKTLGPTLWSTLFG